MFNFRLMLPILGALGGILETHSYSYTYPGTPVYSTESATSYYPQTYSMYPQASYSSYGSTSVYGTYPGATYSCGTTSVIEILDTLFCQHSYHKRYSSKVYPGIDIVIDELTLVTKCAPLESVYQKLEQSIEVLTNLQEATYASYADSSLVRSTYSYPAGSGYNYTSSNSYSSGNPCDAASTLAASLKVYEDRRQGFVQQNGYTTKEKAQAEALQAQAQGKSKRATPELYKRNRFTRGADKEDYTCTLIPSYSSCTSVNYAYILVNILTQIQKAIEINISALDDLKDFILGVTCNDATTKYPLLVAADTFGTILSASDILLDLFNYICKIYEVNTTSYSYSYPASGYPATSMPVSSGPLYRAKEYGSGMSRPLQGYSYGFNSYPSQYRTGRAVAAKTIPAVFLVGR
ncbi:hypothetical protein Ocin01_08318 [Orchesella cincta]|uniref:Uncharacterized protein n=1 Tax=Orchesella cincta TaxID=48709 RepID=A0A1D2MZX8_ORCCI|nr:hypothetical protein Ocin01_08318 [Orchesella cincta]